MSSQLRIVRVCPRMLMGGVEQHVLQLLRGIPGTEMVVPGAEGLAATEARQRARRYQLLSPAQLAPMVGAMRGADLVHLHTINNAPLLPLAVQLAGPMRIVQTIHNNFESLYCRYVDHSFLIGIETRDMIETPSRTSPLMEGVAVPARLPPARAGVRPLRLVEVRRADKEMAWTLEDLIAAGALDGIRFEADIVGVGGSSLDPRIRRVGEVPDPSPWIARADLLVHGSAAETFGRTVYEAMALGTLSVATPLPAFAQRLRDGLQVFLSADMSVAAGARRLRQIATLIAQQPEQCRILATENHRWVQENASSETMLRAQREGYAAVFAAAPAPRNVVPKDAPPDVLPQLSAQLERILRQQALDIHAINALPDRARGLVFWFLADQGVVSDDRRVAVLQESVRLLGERPALCLSLALAARHRGQVPLAQAAFERARDLDPRTLTAALELVSLHLKREDAGAAIAELERLLDHTPDHAAARRYLEALKVGGIRRPSANAMFHSLRRFARIIVTGPHRSGTTIAAEMIASDTGFEGVREEEFDFYREDLLRGVLARQQVVIQCPALFDLMPRLSAPDTAIVLMRRPLDELAASRARMFTPVGGRQLSAEEQNQAQLARLGARDGDAAALKYALWDQWVAEGTLHNPVEVDYHDLSKHPMWVPADQRRKQGRRWHNRRTRL
ncbi:MAG: glycosyltransferase [Myxococcota bacterium]